MKADSYPGGWFGESWGAPACDPARHKPTPVGDPCIECKQPIEADDEGMLIPFVRLGGEPAELCAYHLPCFLATILPRRDR